MSKTILQLKDEKANLLKANDDLFEKLDAEKRKATQEELDSIESNINKVGEIDLRIRTEERKLSTDADSGGARVIKTRKEPFSLLKAIYDKAEQRSMSDTAKDVFTLGKQEFRRAGVSASGDIVIPAEVRADILAGSATAGEEIVATDKGNILPPLVDRLVFREAGVTFLTGLVGNVSIPSYAGTTVGWKGEVIDADDGGGAFTDVEFTPKRLTAYIDVSRLFLAQDGVGAERLLLNNIVNAVARKLEETIFGKADVSATQPMGMAYLLEDAAVGTAAAVVPEWGDIVELETDVDTANALQGNLAYITSGAGRGILKTIERASDTGKFLMADDGTLNGYPVYVTNSIPDNAGHPGADGALLVFGNWADLCIAQWGGYDVTVDPYSLAKSNQVRITINAYFDAKGLRGEEDDNEYARSFSRIAIKAS